MMLDLLEQMQKVDINNLDAFGEAEKLEDGLYIVTIKSVRVSVKEEKSTIYYMVDYDTNDGKQYTQFITLNAQTLVYNASKLLKLIQNAGEVNTDVLTELRTMMIQNPNDFIQNVNTFVVGKKGQLELKTNAKGFQNATFLIFPF